MALAFGYPYTPEVSTNARWLTIAPHSQLHIGFVIALASAVAVYILLEKTTFGLNIKAMGHNPVASVFRVHQTPHVRLLLHCSLAVELPDWLVQVLSFGVQYRLRPDLSPGYGFTAIIIAMLGGLNPLAVIFASIFFGGLLTGSVRMQIITKVPVALIDVIQAIILLFLLGAQVMAKYRLKKG